MRASDVQQEIDRMTTTRIVTDSNGLEYVPCCTDRSCPKCKAATPPQRKPLSDEEIDQLLPEIVSGGTFTVITYGRAVARAIEAAHGIKGEA